MKKSVFIVLTILFVTSALSVSYAKDGESSAWGGSGLVRVPDARIIEDGDLRLSFSHSAPYRIYSAAFGFWPFLELSGRLTELPERDFSRFGWSGYGVDKNSAVDAKVLLFRETDYLPALAVGLQDFQGSQDFFSEYIALSKSLFEHEDFGAVDLTVGYGGNLFGDLLRNSATERRELAGAFAGIEWAIHENVSLLSEYDPTDDLALGRGDVTSNYNFGIRWQPRDWLTLGYSHQRGREHGVMASLTYAFGKPLLSGTTQPERHRATNRAPLISRREDRPVFDRLTELRQKLVQNGWKDAQVELSADMNTIYVELENRLYHSNNRAIARVLRVIAPNAPGDVNEISLILTKNGIRMVEVSVAPGDYIDFMEGKIPSEDMVSKMEIKDAVEPRMVWWDREYAEGKGSYPAIQYRIDPVRIDTYWDDTSEMFEYRMGPGLSLERQFIGHWDIGASVSFPVYSNVDARQPPLLDDPVRSDRADFLDDTGVSVDRLYLNRISRLSDNSYYQLTAGYMELQYAGVSAEYLRTYWDGRVGVGGEVTWAQKRDSGSSFGLESHSTFTRYLNLNYYSPGLETTFETNYGKFLAGDVGARIQVTRDIRGAKVFIWYSETDTSDFTGGNKGYSDKGVGFSLPVVLFGREDIGGAYDFRLTPWARDVGQRVDRPYSLYEWVREFTPAYLENNYK